MVSVIITSQKISWFNVGTRVLVDELEKKIKDPIFLLMSSQINGAR